MRLSQQTERCFGKEKVMSDELSVPSPSQQVSVLVVDDADVIRKTLRNFLKGEPAVKLLGEASNFAEAISMTAALKPDVILLDLHMPDDRSFNPEFVKANLSGARVLVSGSEISPINVPDAGRVG
jgi:DNA-binding NarL/FixJ family response regulator